MVIVRSLTTLLNFKLDTTNLKKFNNEIFGIKTRVNSIFGEISDRVRTGFDFLSDISKAALQTQDLAKYSGIALKDFIALRNVAGAFGVDAEKFNATFSKFSLGIKEASRRTGFLFEVIRQLPNQINIFDKNGILRPTQEVIFDVIKSISKMKNETEKVRILGNIFGDIHEGLRWLEIFEKSETEFKKLINDQAAFANQFEKDTAGLNAFNTELNKFIVSYQSLKTLIGGIIAPNITELLKDVNKIVDSLSNASINNKEQLNRINDYAFFGPIVYGIGSIYDFLTKPKTQAEASTTNNNITVNVEPLTTEQQANDIANEITIALNNFHDEKVRELINNNPVFEA